MKLYGCDAMGAHRSKCSLGRNELEELQYFPEMLFTASAELIVCLNHLIDWVYFLALLCELRGEVFGFLLLWGANEWVSGRNGGNSLAKIELFFRGAKLGQR